MTSLSRRLEGRVAIITGAASGIGRATALRFAREGARVVIADIDVARGAGCAEEIRSFAGEARFVETDVSQESDLIRMIDCAVTAYGGLDILHNNAFWARGATALETTAKDWQRTIDVTLRPVWQASQLAIPQLMKSRFGVIVNTASVHSIVGLTGSAAYQASKGGVLSLTRALSLELAPQIRVVAILPGTIDTPANREVPDEVNEAFLQRVPLARRGHPDEIASVAAFLASDDASYITGAGIVVDGGYTTH